MVNRLYVEIILRPQFALVTWLSKSLYTLDMLCIGNPLIFNRFGFLYIYIYIYIYTGAHNIYIYIYIYIYICLHTFVRRRLSVGQKSYYKSCSAKLFDLFSKQWKFNLFSFLARVGGLLWPLLYVVARCSPCALNRIALANNSLVTFTRISVFYMLKYVLL